jgi:pyruvate formate lyase activating enzyme
VSEGIVFDIQHYAVHDGPGIRTLVFFKGCPLRCAWCCNPESQSFFPELKKTAWRCHACASCTRVCPAGAAGEVDGRPLLDRQSCRRDCGFPCVDACPHGALENVGTRVTAGDVMARVGADKAFYDNSGGGVTFSGGEPFAQPAFLHELLERSKALGIHTTVETCGHAEAGAMARSEPLVDLMLFDVKVADPARHEALTGASNALILSNLRRLARQRPDRLRVRIPIVPGWNDDIENLRALASLGADLGLRVVELMPYHELGRDKYESLGRVYQVETPPVGALANSLRNAAATIEASGVACRFWE